MTDRCAPPEEGPFAVLCGATTTTIDSAGGTMHWSRLLMVTLLVVALAVPASATFKWAQGPDYNDTGINVECCDNGDEPYVLADDFLCTDMGPLTQICIWGSWAHDEPPFMNATNVGFTLSIHADIPADQNPNGWYSMPGECLWYHEFQPGEFTIEENWGVYKWWLSPGSGAWFPCCAIVYKYCFTLDEEWTFFQLGTEAEPIVYWLDVQAHPMEQDKYFGWISTTNHWNDDAAWATGGEPYEGVWQELVYPVDHPWALDSIDLAFEIEGDTPIGEDFGDAPDPTYPTVIGSNGAMHPFYGGYQMGQFIDGELDGQPTPMADGDDTNNMPDEDGVTFSMPLMTGQQATMYVDMVTSSAGGYIDAWIDFGADGSWAEAGDQIVASGWAPAGTITPFTFMVPASANPAQTFARIRMSSAGGLSYDGMAMDGEVEDYMLFIEDGGQPGDWKWEQLPDLGTTGIDVNATEMFVLADDFLCEAPGRLTQIDIWGSWLYDILPFSSDPMAVEFILSIHEDIPAWESPTGFSMPGDVLWVHQIPAGGFNVEIYAEQIVEGWMDPPEQYIMPADWTCWQYSFEIPPEMAFHQTGMPDSGVVYWLDVQARPMDGAALFGWKTTTDHWNDDAVWGMGLEPYFGPWDELIYPPQHEWAGQSIDLAFRLGMDSGTGVPDDVIPTTHSLRQNTPNPFNPMTEIAYAVPAGGGHVTIEVFDVNGRLVTTLVDGFETEGVRTVTWDGTDANGDAMATGVYFYRMTAGEETAMKKMMLLK